MNVACTYRDGWNQLLFLVICALKSRGDQVCSNLLGMSKNSGERVFDGQWNEIILDKF